VRDGYNLPRAQSHSLHRPIAYKLIPLNCRITRIAKRRAAYHVVTGPTSWFVRRAADSMSLRMKLGPAAGGGRRRRCSSVGRRYDNGVNNIPAQPDNARRHHLPRIAQSTGSQPDHGPRYHHPLPGLLPVPRVCRYVSQCKAGFPSNATHATEGT